MRSVARTDHRCRLTGRAVSDRCVPPSDGRATHPRAPAPASLSSAVRGVPLSVSRRRSGRQPQNFISEFCLAEDCADFFFCVPADGEFPVPKLWMQVTPYPVNTHS